MDWSNERYVRVYTRDTITWKLLKWEGQSVLMFVMRRMDRAGAMDLGGVTPYEALEATTDLPPEFIKTGLDRCLARGVLTVVNGSLFMPNFLDAQETPHSDKERAKASREKRRDLLRLQNVTKRDSITDCDNPSQNVTKNNVASQNVMDCFEKGTIRHSGPSVPSVLTDICPPPAAEDDSRSVGPKIVEGIKVATNVKRKPRPEERALWEFWRKTMSKSDAHVLDNKRLLAMARSLANHTLVEMQKVVLGCRNSKYHMGENDSQTKYNDIELICRDEKHFTDFIRLYKPGDERAYGENFTDTNA